MGRSSRFRGVVPCWLDMTSGLWLSSVVVRPAGWMGSSIAMRPGTGRSSVTARRGSPGSGRRTRSIRGNGGASWGVVIVGDTELCSVLVLTVGIADELNPVAGVACWLEMVARCPDVLSAVCYFLDDRVQRLGISLRAFEKNESHSALCRRLPLMSSGVMSTCL